MPPRLSPLPLAAAVTISPIPFVLIAAVGWLILSGETARDPELGSLLDSLVRLGGLGAIVASAAALVFGVPVALWRLRAAAAGPREWLIAGALTGVIAAVALSLLGFATLHRLLTGDEPWVMVGMLSALSVPIGAASALLARTLAWRWSGVVRTR